MLKRLEGNIDENNIIEPIKTLESASSELYTNEAIDLMKVMVEEYAVQDKLLYKSIIL